eukprot:GDKH01000951.1.p2 GENE.GDKH01000951.1~~GDKH01000951.1.p2  ORF type:complete len:50 (-),score=3.87 GDKH01000951.1:447-596(-)
MMGDEPPIALAINKKRMMSGLGLDIRDPRLSDLLSLFNQHPSRGFNPLF